MAGAWTQTGESQYKSVSSFLDKMKQKMLKSNNCYKYKIIVWRIFVPRRLVIKPAYPPLVWDEKEYANMITLISINPDILFSNNENMVKMATKNQLLNMGPYGKF